MLTDSEAVAWHMHRVHRVHRACQAQGRARLRKQCTTAGAISVAVAMHRHFEVRIVGRLDALSALGALGALGLKRCSVQRKTSIGLPLVHWGRHLTARLR